MRCPGAVSSGARRVLEGNPRYREISNHRAQVKLLLKDRVDVIIADGRLVQWYIRHLEEDSGETYQVDLHPLFSPVPSTFACREGGSSMNSTRAWI